MSNDGYNASGSGAAAAADPMIGQVIDKRYKITRKLGEGGMGEVYAADHLRINRRLALKLLRAEVLTNEEAVKRFEQEAMTASSIGHENIIRIEDSGKLEDGRIYLAMELLDGLPFNDLIDTQDIGPERLLNILIQTCHGLRAAHDKNIIHRDMKPENIYITTNADGSDLPKLLDFGIAKVSQAEGENHLTRTGTIFGTPFYMAPEQALGQGVDSRVDIYAMGVIMYEVFTGEVPFGGESFMGILTQHITSEPRLPSATAQQNGRVLFPGIEDVILKAMKKEPADRYQNMSELVEALIPLYRMVAGSGMSTYMAAHQPASGAMPPLSGGVAPVSGGYAQHNAPTPMPVIHDDGSQPYAIPMGAPPGSGHPGTHPPGTHPPGTYPPGTQAPATYPPGTHAPSYPEPGDSLLIPATKSRKGLFIALAIVLLAAAGAAAFVLTRPPDEKTVASNSDDKDPTDVVVPAVDAGRVGVATTAGIDAGSVAVVTADAGATVAAVVTDANTGKIPTTNPPVIKKTAVLLNSKPQGAKVIRNGTKIGRTPLLVMVPAGETVNMVLKMRKFKDQQIELDGAKEKFTAKLERKSGRTTPNRPPDVIPDVPPPRLKFCDRPENKRKTKCLCKKNPNLPVCELE